MKQVFLGNTEMSVSELCLGTMYFGTKLNQAQSELMLDCFVDCGGNFIDTSNNYAFWMENGKGDESEEAIGRWLSSGRKREEIILATKCGGRPTIYKDNLDDIKLEGLSFNTILKTVEGSLKRLNTDYLDVLYSHIDFLEYPIDERLEAFTRLKKQGKVRCLGTSNTQAWRILESQNRSKELHLENYSVIQQKYSFLRPKYNADFWVQKLLNSEMLDLINNRDDLTITVYSTLLSGAYVNFDGKLPNEYNTPDSIHRMATLKQMAEEKGIMVNQLVLAWIMHHTPKIIPLITGSKVDQLKESIESTGIELTKSEFVELSNSGD